MKKALGSLITLLVASCVVAIPVSIRAQNRERFVISAHAGGINAVTGRATLQTHGSGDWQQLTTKEDLETGDVVRTGLDGRVEMLLNPGSYLRIGENSEIELTDNSLDNLNVRLVRGTAIVEVTGNDDTRLLINIITPHTRLAIVRRGLYRVNVVPGDATELIVRKGRVMLEPAHTKIKGGDKVVFSDNSFSVAKLKTSDKNRDNLETWSKSRAETLAQANSRIPRRDVDLFLATTRVDYWLTTFAGRPGCWLYLPSGGFYTFFPFSFGWGSPYGSMYATSFFGGPGWLPYSWQGSYGGPGAGSGSGTGSGAGHASGGGVGGDSLISARPGAPTNAGSEAPTRARDMQPPAPSHRPDMP